MGAAWSTFPGCGQAPAGDVLTPPSPPGDPQPPPAQDGDRETSPAAPSPATESLQDKSLDAELEAKVRAAKDKLNKDGRSEDARQDAARTLAALDSRMKELEAASSSRADVKDVELPLTKAEKHLLQYSVLGQVIVDVGSNLLGLVPHGIGSIVAAGLGAIYTTALTAASNKDKCSELLKQMEVCDQHLARVVQHLGSQAATLRIQVARRLPDTLQGLCDVARVIKRAAGIIKQYSQHTCVTRFFASYRYQHHFEDLQKRLLWAMLCTSLACGLELLVDRFQDDAVQLRQAICDAAGMPTTQVQQAIRHLINTQPDKLRQLLRENGSFSDQLIEAQLADLAQQVSQLQDKVRTHSMRFCTHSMRFRTLEEQLAASTAQQNKGPDGLQKCIKDWWLEAFDYNPSIPWLEFKARLVQKAPHAIEACGSWLQKEVDKLLPACEQPGSELFLERVLRVLLDENSDDHVTLHELKMLQVMGLEHTKRHGLPDPEDIGQLIRCVYWSYPAALLHNQLAPSTDLTAISEKLAVLSVIRSYNTARLLDEFLDGTRTWLFDKVMDWQQAAVVQTSGTSRMFLLLAEAGMGKSVCSAVLWHRFTAARTQQSKQVMVRHFFKVGQQRGEGKSMIKCLVQQLCGQLPALVPIVHDVLAQLPSLDALSMAELFDKILLEPLQQLDQQQEAPPCALLLLDALDESTDESKDSGQGWQRVCNLMATQFKRLPSWVCVLVTGRPQVKDRFSAWEPEWILPNDSNNMTDLRELLLAKLRDSTLVERKDVAEAAQLLLDKSKGQFIYAKYVFNILMEQRHWSLKQLQDLPDGLSQVYCYQLDTIAAALQAEKPHLADILQRKLLPMLAVMKEPLSVSVLAWLTEVDEADVQLLLQLLYSLFPSRPGPDGTTVVAPYHKSIQDFLLLEPGQARAPAAQQQWHTPAAEAHGLFVARLLPELQATQLHHWQDKCGPQVLRDLPAGQQYCLQYLVDHIALAQDWAALHQLLQHLPGLKAVLEVPGQVYKLIRVLADAAAGCQDADWQRHFRSVQRFLRASCHVINTQPHGILQDMACSPRDCVLGDWCEQDYHVRQALPGSTQQEGAVAMWRGACLVTARAEQFPPEVATLGPAAAWSCAVSLDGQLLVCKGDETIQVWDLPTGQLRVTLEGFMSCIAIGPNGPLMVSGIPNNTPEVWDLATGQLCVTLRGHFAGVQSCTISPDGQTLVTGFEDNTLQVWDLATGQLRITLQGHGGRVHCCAISPDGHLLVYVSAGETLKVWDLATGQLHTTLEGHTGHIWCCTISPAGHLIVCVSDEKTLKVWNLATGQCTTLQGDGNLERVDICAMSSDGRLLATWVDGPEMVLKVWNLATGQLYTTLQEHSPRVWGCAFSPDGQLLVSACGSQLLVRSLLAPSQAEDWAAGATAWWCCTVSPDGQLLVCGSYDKTIKVWDMATGQLVNTLQGRDKYVRRCTISPDGQLLVIVSVDWTSTVWDLSTGQLRTLEGHNVEVYCSAISPDSQLLVSQSGPWYDRAIKVWDLATGQLRSSTKDACGENCFAISPDGQLLVSGHSEGTLKVRDLASGQLRNTFLGHTSNVHCCTISPDSQLLVSGSDDGTLEVWDLATGQLRSTLEGHTRYVFCCAISPDGQTLVSGSQDGTLKVWDLATGQLRTTLEGHTQAVSCCAISPDGQTLVTLSHDKTLKVYMGKWQQGGAVQPQSSLFTQWGYFVGHYVV